MKTKIIRLISLTLALLMILTATACGGSTTASVEIPEMLTKGKFTYAIVYPQKATTELTDAVKDFRINVRKNLSCAATLSKDVLDYDAQTYELLVGETNRPETADAKKILKENRKNSANDFIVKATGYKIVIYAFSDDVTQKALEWFLETFCKDEKSWENLYNGYEFIYQKKFDEKKHNIAGVELSKFRIVTPFNCAMVAYKPCKEMTDFYFAQTGVKMELVNDLKAETDYEILIGNTNRKESQVDLAGKDYTIRVVGKKLVINAKDDATLAIAVKVFYNDFVNSAKEDKIFSYTKDHNVTEMATFTDSDYKLVWSLDFNSKADYKGWTIRGKSVNEKQSVLGTDFIWYSGEDFDKYTTVKDGIWTLPYWCDKTTRNFYAPSAQNKKVQFRYGLWEARYKQADSPATLSWWFGTVQQLKWQPRIEIDALENFGYNDYFRSNVHRWWDIYNADGSVDASGGHTSIDGTKWSEDRIFNVKEGEPLLDDEFYVLSMEWTPDFMSFAANGDVFYTYDIKSEFQNRGPEVLREVILQPIFGGRLGSSVYGNVRWSEDMIDNIYETKIDYMRIYQRSDFEKSFFTTNGEEEKF
ncbi:MAG: hypothetical protein IJD55_02170 [Clostridia bacterium]|nr:hypothetical protein [Clostridia bacterium]